jgi:hypothetical protein
MSAYASIYQAGSRASSRATCVARHWPTPPGVRMRRLLSAAAMPLRLVTPVIQPDAQLDEPIDG